MLSKLSTSEERQAKDPWNRLTREAGSAVGWQGGRCNCVRRWLMVPDQDPRAIAFRESRRGLRRGAAS
jgi:hypothetical protein